MKEPEGIHKNKILKWIKQEKEQEKLQKRGKVM